MSSCTPWKTFAYPQRYAHPWLRTTVLHHLRVNIHWVVKVAFSFPQRYVHSLLPPLSHIPNMAKFMKENFMHKIFTNQSFWARGSWYFFFIFLVSFNKELGIPSALRAFGVRLSGIVCIRKLCQFNYISTESPIVRTQLYQYKAAYSSIANLVREENTLCHYNSIHIRAFTSVIILLKRHI